MALNLLVLKATDVAKTVHFYETILDVEFREEKHGGGPAHYAATLLTCVPPLVIEVYPGAQPAAGTSLGFYTPGVSAETFLGLHDVPWKVSEDKCFRTTWVNDPDGRRVLLTEDLPVLGG